MDYSKKLLHPLWKQKQQIIFWRDDWKCKECGRTDLQLECHHLKYTTDKPWNEPDENLQTLCCNCHRIVSTGIDFNIHKEAIRNKLLKENIRMR